MTLGQVFARRRRRGALGRALAGLAAGAGLAYFLDPVRGAERRAGILERTRRAARDVERSAEARARDVAHRARGAAHEARARVAHEQVPDEVLVERVRARLGRLVAHPRAIRVAAREGRVELSGAVFRAEQAELLRGVRGVRGVGAVEDRLQPHEAGDDVPAELQGAGPRAARARQGWPAGATAVAVALGSVATARALLGRRLLGVPAALAGAALARGALHGAIFRDGSDARERAREDAREARRTREQESEREAHAGAWHPEPEAQAGDAHPGPEARAGARRPPEVREVKSPAELEPGVAHASPEPTFPSRVSRRGGGRRPAGAPRPSGRARAKRGARDAAGDADTDRAAPTARSGYVSPPAGAPVRGDDLGSVPGPDVDEE